MEAQGALAAKKEPDTPQIMDKVILGPDSFVEKFTDGKIYVTTAGTKEQISEALYQVFLKQSLKRVASSTVPTALASQPDDDEEPTEWGDMDPSFSRMLQSTPSMLAVYKALRTPRKMAKLDATTVSFQPSITLENLRSTIQHYHDTSVQPSLELLNKTLREEVTRRVERSELHQLLGSYSLSAMEAEQQRRSVLIYNIPQFSNMSTITSNLNYLLGEAGLTRSDVQSISNHLHTSSSAFMRVIFLQESSSRLFLQAFKQKRRYWLSANQEDSQLKIEKDIPLQERLDRIPLMTINRFPLIINDVPPP